jgi:hypothetical protein
LIKTAKSKDAGRLPFVPKETKEKAGKLVAEIKSKAGGAGSPPKYERRTSRPAGPQASQPKAKRDVKLPEFAAQTRRKPIKLKEPEARKLEREIPRFRTQGATIGPAIVEQGETTTNIDNVSVTYREGSKEAARPELPPNNSALRRDAAAAEKRRSTPSVNREAAAAPTNAQRRPPTAAASTGGGGAVAGARASVGGGKPTRIEGTLRIEGMQQDGEALAQLNARIVDLEGEMNG